MEEIKIREEKKYHKKTMSQTITDRSNLIEQMTKKIKSNIQENK